MKISLKKLALIFKALSDETRITMLALLIKNRELCVCDFVESLKITQSKASRHLRYLCNAGLVNDRRDKIWVYYKIKSEKSDESRKVIYALSPLLIEYSSRNTEIRLANWLKKKKRKDKLCH